MKTHNSSRGSLKEFAVSNLLISFVCIVATNTAEAEASRCQSLFSLGPAETLSMSPGALAEMANLYLELNSGFSILQFSESETMASGLRERMVREWQTRFDRLTAEDREQVRSLILESRAQAEEKLDQSKKRLESQHQVEKNHIESLWPKSEQVFVHPDPVKLDDLNYNAGAFFDPTPGKRFRAGIQWTEQGRYVAIRSMNFALSTKIYDMQAGRVLDLPPIGYLTREGNYFVEPKGNETIYHDLVTGDTRRFQGVPRIFANQSSDHYFLVSDQSGEKVELVDIRHNQRIPLAREMAFSKAGDKIAYIVDRQIHIVDLRTGQVRRPVPGRELSTVQSPIGESVWLLGDLQKKKMVLFDVATEKLYEPRKLNQTLDSWNFVKDTHFLHRSEQVPVPNPGVVPHPGEFYNFVTGAKFQYQGGQMRQFTVSGKPMALISDSNGIRPSQLISLEDAASPRVVMTLAPGSQPSYVGDLVFQRMADSEFYVQLLRADSDPIHVPDLKSAVQLRSYYSDWAVGLVDLNAGKKNRETPDYHSLDPFSGKLTPMSMQLVNVSPDHRWQWVHMNGHLELRRFEDTSP